MRHTLWVVGALVVGFAGGIWAGALWGVSLSSNMQPPQQNSVYALSAAGTIVSLTSTSITLKLPDGSTKEYALSPTTQVMATVAAGKQPPTLSTLKDGTLVSLTLASAGGQTMVTSITVAPVGNPAH